MKQDESNQDKSSEMSREEAVARMKQRMEEDAKSPSGRAEPGFSRGDFVKGFLLTGIPATAIGVFTAVGYRASGGFDNGIGYLFLWLLGPLAFIVTMIIGLVSSAFGTRSARAGVLVGIGVAVISLGTSCFALAHM
jgi:hypothetical protein